MVLLPISSFAGSAGGGIDSSAWANERLASCFGRGRETVVVRQSGCSKDLLLYRCCVNVLVLLVLFPLSLLLMLILGLAVAVVLTDIGLVAVLVLRGLGLDCIGCRRIGEVCFTGDGVDGQPSLPKPRAWHDSADGRMYDCSITSSSCSCNFTGDE